MFPYCYDYLLFLFTYFLWLPIVMITYCYDYYLLLWLPIVYVYLFVWLLLRHNIEGIGEDDFCKSLEEFKYPTIGKFPSRCSAMQYSGRYDDLSTRHVSRIRASVISTSIYLCLCSKELIKLKALDFRGFYRMWSHFIYRDWDLFWHCKGC